MRESSGSRVRRWARVCAAFALVMVAPAPVLGADSASGKEAGASSWLGAYNKSEWAVSVALLESIPERSRTPMQWLYLARAREKLSLLVEAVDAYERTRESFPPKSRSAADREIRRKADEEAGAVARRLPWAEIALSSEVPPGAYVFVDEVWLPPARLRSPYPVNPGWHTFLLEVDGEIRAARRVYFAESQQRPVLLAPKLERGTSAASSSPLPPRSWIAVTSTREPPRARYTEQDRDLRAASYLALGGGALGLLMGTGFVLHRAKLQSDLDDIEELCASSCTPERREERDLRQQIRASTQVANVSFVFGGLSALTGGVLYYLSSRREPKRTESASLQPLLGLGSAGVMGRF